MPREPNPAVSDEVAPEATEEWFQKASPASDVLPGLLGKSAAQQLL
jgi:hypothetical protein